MTRPNSFLQNTVFDNNNKIVCLVETVPVALENSEDKHRMKPVGQRRFTTHGKQVQTTAKLCS